MRNIKTVLALVLTVLVLGFAPANVRADEQVCTQVYGGGVVCGVATQHEPVEAAGFNPAVLAVGLLSVSGGLLILSKKIKSNLN